MRINNNIRTYAIFSERHITPWNNVTNRTFLSMTTAKFVSNNRLSNISNSYFTTRVAITIPPNKIFINISIFTGSKHSALIFVFCYLCMIAPRFFNRQNF